MTGPEWFCKKCQRWVNGLVCRGCLRADPASVRWATEWEIQMARADAIAGRNR